MSAIRRSFPIATALGLLLATACGGGPAEVPSPATVGGPEQTEPVTVVGPGGAQVTVPPGAIEKPIEIRIVAASAAPTTSASISVVGPAFEITPHGMTFAAPVTVRVPLDATRVPANAQIVMLKANPGGETEIHLGARRVDDTVELDATGFSNVAAAVLPPDVGTVTDPFRFETHPVDGAEFDRRIGYFQWMVNPTRPVGLRVWMVTNRAWRPQTACDAVLVEYVAYGEGNKQVGSYTNFLASPHTTSSIALLVEAGAFSYSAPDGLIDLDRKRSPSFDVQPWQRVGQILLQGMLSCPSTGEIIWGSMSVVGKFDSTTRITTIGFGREPLATSVASGETAAFSARVVGGNWDGHRPPLSNELEWLRSDDGGETWQVVGYAVQAERDVDGLNWLHVRGVRPSDDGALFRMRACYEGKYDGDPVYLDSVRDCALSDAARLTVLTDAAPTITTGPSSATVAAGQTATFTVVSSGVPTPSLQWQSLDPGGAAWVDVSGATGTSYATPSATEPMTGTQYRAIATNRAGTATSAAATLTVLGTGPVVLGVEPRGHAPGVATTATVTAYLSEAVDPATVIFTLGDLVASVAGTVSVTASGPTGSQITFTPTLPLAPGTIYFARIDGSLSDLYGNQMGAFVEWKFFTAVPDTVAPTVTLTSPTNGSGSVATASTVTATFSEAIDPATVTTSTFTLSLGATPVAGTVSVAGSTATFTPASPLLPGSQYTATLSASVADPAGNPLGTPYSWSFGTAVLTPPTIVSVSPADGERWVPYDDPVVVTFSEAMDPASFTDVSFHVDDWEGGGHVLGQTTVVGNTATFRPSRHLAAGLQYQVVVDGVAAVSGAVLAQPSSTFFFIANVAMDARASIAAAGVHTLSIDGPAGTYFTVYAWGSNPAGALGTGIPDGARNDTPAPVIDLTATGLNTIMSVDGAAWYSLALGQDGTVWGWGPGPNIGIDTIVNQRAARIAGLSNICAISAGYRHALALDCSGFVSGWGFEDALVIDPPQGSHVVRPIEGLVDIVAIAAGERFSLALRRDGVVFAWGAGDMGQLGTGDFAGSATPVRVPGLRGIRAIGAQSFTGVARRIDSRVFAWGANNVGQVGNGTTKNQASPVEVLTNVSSIATGNYHTLAVMQDGTVMAWGYNLFGRLGDGTTTDRWSPVVVPGLSGVLEVSGGEFHSAARMSDGSVWTWGQNSSGQLGIGSASTSLVPAKVTFPW